MQSCTCSRGCLIEEAECPLCLFSDGIAVVEFSYFRRCDEGAFPSVEYQHILWQLTKQAVFDIHGNPCATEKHRHPTVDLFLPKVLFQNYPVD